MLDCSNHNYEDMDKYGNYIGIGHEDMGRDMVANDVKCLRDIHGVGASTVKLIEEWIETGKLKRLEDFKKNYYRYWLSTEFFSQAVTEGDEKEEFEAKHDHMPDFLEALGELAELYEKEDDFRATSFRRAIIALEGQIITAVEDIKLFNLIELRGVGKSTLMMLEEFITSGKIEKLEEKRQQIEPETLSADFLVGMFGHMTEHECEAMYNNWSECGRYTYEPETDEDAT